ncbi:transposase [Glaciecola sp. MH2013]|nr:transposase [Glaciecola sp. MH2013]MBF7074236.1 transposase [Glaciecola sp. MH2013]
MTKRMTESQIVAILKEAEAGMPAKDLCRKYGIASSTFYKWKEKYGGMEASDVKRLKERADSVSDFELRDIGVLAICSCFAGLLFGVLMKFMVGRKPKQSG